MQQLYAEIAIHRSLSQGGKGHPHVLKFLEWFEDDDNVYMVLEICPNRVCTRTTRTRCRRRRCVGCGGLGWPFAHRILSTDRR